MAVYLQCVAKRMRGGYKHEHIQILWWVKCVDGKATGDSGFSTSTQLIDFLASSEPHALWCPDRNPTHPGAWVNVQTLGRKKYLQAMANGRPTDLLLSLPDR